MTDSATVKVEFEIPLLRVADMLVSAFDPAVASTSYWAEIAGYRKPPQLEHTLDRLGGRAASECYVYRYCDYPINKDGAVVVMDTEEGKGYEINLDTIRAGLKVMAEKFPEHFADLIGEDDDATTSDVFVQCCVFGDVIYG